MKKLETKFPIVKVISVDDFKKKFDIEDNEIMINHDFERNEIEVFGDKKYFCNGKEITQDKFDKLIRQRIKDGKK